MRSWSRSLGTFGVGYFVATAVGFATFTRPVLMWAITFTVMPLVFAALAYWYFRGTRLRKDEARREAWRLTALWIALSFLLDALAYVVVIPLAFHAQPNWTFFIDQSPWIWLCYATIVPIVFAGLWAQQRRAEGVACALRRMPPS